MLKNNMQKQKGVSLYLTMLFLSLLLAMILGLTNIIVGGANITKGLGDSVKAFHAADTGVEHALYNSRRKSPLDCTDINGSTVFTDYGYTVDVSLTGVCGETGTTIQSIGTYYGVSRKIEAEY